MKAKNCEKYFDPTGIGQTGLGLKSNQYWRVRV